MIDRRKFVLLAGASVGGTAFGSFASGGTAAVASGNLGRQTFRRIGGRWIRIPSFLEKAGDRVHFAYPVPIDGESETVARFVLESAPEGHEGESVLTPIQA